MVLHIVSNNPVTVTFDLNGCELYNEYFEFSKRSKQLNMEMDTPLPSKGQLFEVTN